MSWMDWLMMMRVPYCLLAPSSRAASALSAHGDHAGFADANDADYDVIRTAVLAEDL